MMQLSSVLANRVRELRRDAALLQKHLKAEPLVGVEELHARRIKEIKYIYLKAVTVPRFSSRLDVSLDDLIVCLLRLKVPGVIAELRQIFPAEAPAADDAGYGE